MKILASEQVATWLQGLPPDPKRRVRAALRELEAWDGDIKPLRGELEGFYRLRVGGYRIVYHLAENQVLRLDYADTRDAVYEAFRQLRILGEMNE
jgi:mRNA interferase RelE/StbE